VFLTNSDIRNIFTINVVATMDVVKRVLPVMRKQRSGYIVNIGSVAAFSEVIALDVKEFGIRVTVVYVSAKGKQAGNPDRAAEIFMALAENPEPPIHLFLGSDAYGRATSMLSNLSRELERWKSVTVGADRR
jgi:NAD(P)-dependent dehydrogenase (short-subunit alcohol dehydrogenase family)